MFIIFLYKLIAHNLLYKLNSIKKRCRLTNLGMRAHENFRMLHLFFLI